MEHDCDIIAVTETWLPCEDLLAKQIIGDLCPEGYKMSHIPRSTGHRGGGIGILYKYVHVLTYVLLTIANRPT